jgi:hypothetical protein
MPAAGATRAILLAAAAGLLLATTAGVPAGAVEELRSANVAEVGRGMRIGWMRGHIVVNDENERIGTIYEFVIGADSTPFAILQIGEFLGKPAYLVAVPFKGLTVDRQRAIIRLPGATREALRNFRPFIFFD